MGAFNGSDPVFRHDSSSGCRGGGPEGLEAAHSTKLSTSACGYYAAVLAKGSCGEAHVRGAQGEDGGSA